MLTIALVLLSTVAIEQSALEAAKSEPVLDRRAVKAVDAAGVALTEARKQYEQGEEAKFEAALGEMVQGMELALTTLEAMGKHPSRNTRNYKVIEMKTRDLLRRVTTFRQDCGFEDRPKVEKAEKRITEIHEKLVDGVMSRKP